MKVKVFELTVQHKHWAKGTRWEESRDSNYIAVANGGSNLYLKSDFGTSSEFKSKFRQVGTMELKETAEYIEQSAGLQRRIRAIQMELEAFEKALEKLSKQS